MVRDVGVHLGGVGYVFTKTFDLVDGSRGWGGWVGGCHMEAAPASALELLLAAAALRGQGFSLDNGTRPCALPVYSPSSGEETGPGAGRRGWV